MTKLLARYAFGVMTTLLALVLVWQFRVAVLYLLLSVTIAATLRPLSTRLEGRKLGERIAWIIVYLVGVVGFAFILYLASQHAIVEVQQLTSTISTQDAWVLPAWMKGSLFEKMLVMRFPPPKQLFQMVTFGQGQIQLPAILGFTQSIASLVGGLVVILVMSIYWMISKTHFERLWLSLLPSEQRKQALGVWEEIEPNLGAYIRSQLISSLLVGLLLSLGYWAIGSPYPLLLALVASLACLIPFFGVVLAVLIPLLTGILTGMSLTLLLVVYTIGVLIALGIWIKPRISHHRWDNPILTLVVLIGLAKAFGLVGVIIAPPIASILQIIWSLLINQRVATSALNHDSDLKKRQENVWTSIQAMDEPPPLVINTVERLSRLIEKAEPYLITSQQEQTTEPVLPNIHQSDKE